MSYENLAPATDENGYPITKAQYAGLLSELAAAQAELAELKADANYNAAAAKDAPVSS